MTKGVISSELRINENICRYDSKQYFSLIIKDIPLGVCFDINWENYTIKSIVYKLNEGNKLSNFQK